MIQAIVRDGTIQPLGALPADWHEGQRLIVDCPRDSDDEPETLEAIEEWYRDWCLSSAQIDPEDERRFLQAIDDHRREQKELMRRTEPSWPNS